MTDEKMRVTFIDSLCKHCFEPMQQDNDTMICPKCKKRYDLKLHKVEIVRWYQATNVSRDEIVGEKWYYPVEVRG
jgi:predicted amidophosphoribosyltransferase